jgi:hypothetical protein
MDSLMTFETKLRTAVTIIETWINAGMILGEEIQKIRRLAVQAAWTETGIDFTPLLDDQTRVNECMPPAQLAELYGVSVRRLNLLLEKKGFQVRVGKLWKVTESGKCHSVIKLIPSPDSGRAEYRLLWNPSVLKHLKGE